MGVSAETINPDLNALMAGGDAFLKRVAELKATKESAEAALAELSLGQSAKAASVKADALLAEAKNKYDSEMAALAIELQSARDKIGSWSEQTRNDAQALQTEAAKANEQAQSLRVIAEEERMAARKALGEAENVAQKIVADAEAQARLALAEGQNKVSQLTADVIKLKKETVAALAAAKEAEAKFKAKLEAIQSATAAALMG